MKNTALYGNNIWTPIFKEKRTIGECQKACMYNSDCRFWSYRKQDKQCAIKTSKGYAREGNNNQWESGASDCNPRGGLEELSIVYRLNLLNYGRP